VRRDGGRARWRWKQGSRVGLLFSLEQRIRAGWHAPCALVFKAWQVAVGRAKQVSNGMASRRMTSGPRWVLNLNNFSSAQLQNLKRCSSGPPQFMKHSEVVEEIKGNNFPYWPNFKFSQDFKL
jgi:hypothetical protein